MPSLRCDFCHICDFARPNCWHAGPVPTTTDYMSRYFQIAQDAHVAQIAFPNQEPASRHLERQQPIYVLPWSPVIAQFAFFQLFFLVLNLFIIRRQVVGILLLWRHQWKPGSG